MDTHLDTPGSDPAAEKLWSLIGEMKFAMMTTEDGEVLRSRPMAAVDRDPRGGLWFFTHASSHKVAEIGGDQRVNLSYADPGRETYVSLSGRASLVRDPAEVAARWDDGLSMWFPKGRDDADTALLRVQVDRAEYWDVASFTMRHLHDVVTEALVADAAEPVDHAKLTLRQGALRSTDSTVM